jgi:citrate synthase
MTGHGIGKGAAGTRAGSKGTSMVYTEAGKDTCRGYAVRELCRRHSFEEVAYLLWHGELPSRDQILAQNRTERAQRTLDRDIAAAIADQPFTTSPIDILRSAVMLLGAMDPTRHEITHEAVPSSLGLSPGISGSCQCK